YIQNALGVDYSNATSGLTADNVQAAIDELAAELADQTDDQLLQNFQINGANLEISIEDGNTVSVAIADLITAINTDEQEITAFSIFPVNNTLTISIYNLSLHDALPISYIQNALGVDYSNATSGLTAD